MGFKKFCLTLAIVIQLLFTSSCSPDDDSTQSLINISKERMLADVQYQLDLGPRFPGSSGHLAVGNWIAEILDETGWRVTIQETDHADFPIRNIIGSTGKGEPWVIFGTHYDTRKYADSEEVLQLRQDPVPGANDGASGVALLLELARVLPQDDRFQQIAKDSRIELIFFDAEDNGGIDGMDWAMGSQAYVDNLVELPDSVIIVDMIGDEDLKIFMEGNSDPELLEEIWNEAELLGYADFFVPMVKYHLIDDHTAFINRGIPAVDIIDFDYPYWHTTHDTLDKISISSLEIVGKTLLSWLLNNTK